MKKIVVLKASGGELANQLWNYISVFAFAKEKGLLVENWAFFEYAKYFKHSPAPFLIDKIFFAPMKNNTARKSSSKKRLWRKMYSYLAGIINYIYKDQILKVMDHEDAYYLAPTDKNHSLSQFGDKDTVFLDGWIFRNPIGIAKYRKEIIEYFVLRDDIQASVALYTEKSKRNYTHVFGIHLRQGDYKEWKGGRYFIEQKRVQEIMFEFLQNKNIKSEDACFIIASDGAIEKENFRGLNIQITGKTMAEDLFILSKTDAVLGSDSTFGNFASYLGNIPHIIFQKDNMDWQYYADKTTFFENKYCTWVKY